MKTTMYNLEGREVDMTELPEKIFGIELNRDLVYTVAQLQRARRRQVSAHTKTRGEVSGGGRKPWPQKHTGRARHGSTRSPIWVGGGVAHGPRTERNFKGKINKKMRRKALAMVLAEKAKRKRIIVLENLELESSKTKALGTLLEKLPCDRKKTLLVLPSMNQGVIRAGSNLPYCTTMQAKDLNMLDLLAHTFVVMPRESMEVIEKTFAK